MSAKMPPFSSVLKSRDVEDPVNLWVNRPLAYAFVALIYRTSITPNQVTLLATLIGCTAGIFWFIGTPAWMVVGGILLWTSAIVDGADGILARAKKMQSDLGQALDGAGDLLVAAVTVSAVAYRIWLQRQQPWDFVLLALAIFTAGLHIWLYEYYQRSLIRNTDPTWNGKPERIEQVQQRLEEVKKRKAPWPHVIASYLDLSLITNQTRVVALTNPHGRCEDLRFVVNADTVRIWRKHNLGPMRLWPWISLAPHSYLMAICGMFDQLYLYLLFRVFVANAIFVVAMIWQRRASTRTWRELEQIGAAPQPIE